MRNPDDFYCCFCKAKAGEPCTRLKDGKPFSFTHVGGSTTKHHLTRMNAWAPTTLKEETYSESIDRAHTLAAKSESKLEGYI
jgi:hypothetical protein